VKLKAEQIIQINFVNWFKFTYPDYAEDLIHVGNERKCSIIGGRMLKRMGVMRGVSDLFLGVASHDYHGLWIELKTPTGKLSTYQKAFIERKTMRGYKAKTAYSLEEAQEIVQDYLPI